MPTCRSRRRRPRAEFVLSPGDAAEVARFYRYVVKGPSPRDCFWWVGSIGDDAYGRYWVKRDGRQRVVRPHRYALALALGRPLADTEYALHEVCDNPLCVRAWGEPGTADRPHVVVGTQAQNLAGMGAKGRGGGRTPPWHRSEIDRAGRVARSRRARDALRNGWDAEALHSALLSTYEPTLF